MVVKHIAVFIDGTWNSPSVGAPTNTWLLSESVSACQKKLTPDQLACCYIEGVGTERLRFAVGVRSLTRRLKRWPRKWVGGTTGRGTASRIRQAYEFLCKEYSPGDKIFLFGFSRGAFAARSLAGFVNEVGRLLKDVVRPELVEEAYRIYERRFEPEQSPVPSEFELREFLRGLKLDGSPSAEANALPIHFIGVWDTVGALGLPGAAAALTNPQTAYHNVELPPNVANARHALAMHELRSAFKPTLWTRTTDPKQSLKQVWFAGAHADIGGGYYETGWSDIALHWMAQEARAAGLPFSKIHMPRRSRRLPDPAHELRGGFWFSAPHLRTYLRDAVDMLEDLSLPTGRRTGLSRETLGTFHVHNTAHDWATSAFTHARYMAYGRSAREGLHAVDRWSLALCKRIDGRLIAHDLDEARLLASCDRPDVMVTLSGHLKEQLALIMPAERPSNVGAAESSNSKANYIPPSDDITSNASKPKGLTMRKVLEDHVYDGEGGWKDYCTRLIKASDLVDRTGVFSWKKLKGLGELKRGAHDEERLAATRVARIRSCPAFFALHVTLSELRALSEARPDARSALVSAIPQVIDWLESR